MQSSNMTANSKPWLLVLLLVLSIKSNYLLQKNMGCVGAQHITSMNYPCPAQAAEVDALLEFRHGIRHDPLQRLKSWNVSAAAARCSRSNISSCAANWSGLLCNEKGHVVEIDLSSSSLGGSISPHLGKLQFLQTLNLSVNALTGSIPWELGNCSAMEVLSLFMNQLSGILPGELGSLKRVLFIDVSANELQGSIPPSLSNCSELVGISLDWNQFSGEIPFQLGRLQKLQAFYLDMNPSLEGSIPPELGNCSELVVLQLGMNRLSGPIPIQLGNVPKLQVFAAPTNFLAGPLPKHLANCTSLQQIILFENRISGAIPNELSAIKGLRELNVFNNTLTGEVPTSLHNCSKLEKLLLDLNSLSGRIPAQFATLKQLQRLQISLNHLVGEIPASILSNCTKLENVDLNDNRLSGSIPDQVGSLVKLENLLLANNKLLSGPLPTSISNCTALVGLSLADNRLTGDVASATWFNLSSLQYFALNKNNFFGQLPFHAFHNLLLLQELHLEHNSLSGPLPPSLMALHNLARLYLQGNAFAGSLPQGFLSTSYTQLLELDLSSNKLSGAIPPNSFGSLMALTILNLSHNALSGSIPASLAQVKHLDMLDLSNNQFSQSIPSALSSCVELSILDLSYNNISGFLPLAFNELRNLRKLDLSNNQLEGLVPNQRPYNDTEVTDLASNAMLCGAVVHRECHESKMARKRSEMVGPMIKGMVVGGVLFATILGICLLWLYCNKKSATAARGRLALENGLARKHILAISDEEIRQATNAFNTGCILAVGGTSTVYRATLRDGMVVAIKVLRNVLLQGTDDQKVILHMRREVELLAMVKHRNIVRVLGCCFNLDMQAIILKFMPNGSLDRLLYNAEAGQATAEQPLILSKERRLSVLRGVADGLAYLHHHHPQGTIVHCDLKPANILLDEDYEACISDFGIAKLIQSGNSEACTGSVSALLRGSLGYIPPEYACQAHLSTMGDVYSFGVVMLEILTNRQPTSFPPTENIVSWVESAYPDNLLTIFNVPDMVQDEALALADIALSCTHTSPRTRPTMINVSQHIKELSQPQPSYLHSATVLEQLVS